MENTRPRVLFVAVVVCRCVCVLIGGAGSCVGAVISGAVCCGRHTVAMAIVDCSKCLQLLR